MEIWNKIGTDTLVYTSDWESAVSSVRAKTFGKLVELAENVIERYKSDLWHDAIWLRDTLNGAPFVFEWIVRESGTHIGPSLKDFDWRDWDGVQLYRFEIVCENDRYVLNTYHAVQHAGAVIETGTEEEFELDEAFRPYFETKVPEEFWDSLNRLSQEDDDSNGTFTEDDQGNWHPVEDPLKDIISALFEPNIPTSRNIEQEQEIAPRKENNTMDDIIRDLREKLEEANNAKYELEEAKDNLDQAIDDLDSYVDEIDSLINSLDSLPEVSVYVSVDVSFDS